MFQESFLWLAKQDVTGEDLKVFMAMTSKMDFKNFIRFSQTQLAEEIRIPRPNVSRSIKHLIELDILREGPRAGLNKTYMLNPNMGIKGKQRKQKVIDYEEAKATRIAEKTKKSSTTGKAEE